MFLYYLMDDNNNILYREYRYDRALKYFLEWKDAKKFYLVTKTWKRFKALAMWKDGTDRFVNYDILDV